MANKTIDHAITGKTLKSAASDPTHAGILSFMRRRYTKVLKDVDAVVWGIPFDAATSNRPGARFGPQAIRAASLILCDGIHPLFDVSPVEQLGDALDMLDDDAALKEVMGPEFVKVYDSVKRNEYKEFLQVISPWEREHLLLNV